jgi:type I restriction-modification system DNA methylase subunit
MLLSSYRITGAGHEYYGIDIDRTCVKMAALNLFLNRVWNSEIMCANSLLPNDFVVAYRISFVPWASLELKRRNNQSFGNYTRTPFPAKNPNKQGRISC